MDNLLEVIAKALVDEAGATVRINDQGVDAYVGGTRFRIEVERA